MTALLLNNILYAEDVLADYRGAIVSADGEILATKFQ